MAFSADTWTADVRDAAVAGDEAALRRLYAEGREELGEQASVIWAAVLSALDGTAVTG
jgi:hypothetical protein